MVVEQTINSRKRAAPREQIDTLRAGAEAVAYNAEQSNVKNGTCAVD